MIESDRPTLRGGHGGEGDPREREPARDGPGVGAPLILSLRLAEADQLRLDRLRDAHFPPERNFLRAHVTLFHHLPSDALATLTADLQDAARRPAFPVRVARLRSLGRGVALSLEADALNTLRAGLARRWEGWLGAQDSQRFQPHVTIQNKVDPAEAKRLFAELSAGFAPWTVTATGLSLWWYRGGPWEAAGEWAFLDAEPVAFRAG